MVDQTPCSDISRARDEPLCGTASRVRSWLLIEQPGEWGRDAIVESELDPKLGRLLKQHTALHGIRPLLTRRPDNSASATPACFLAFSGIDDRWALRLDVGSVDELLDLDLSPLEAGIRPERGTEHEDPLYLVCTHALHDACCGRYGPAVAQDLGRFRAEQTWESSHVGGDRFAANLVCLPHGLYFGRVADVRKTVELYESGRVDLPYYRGRSCYVPVVQAAEVLLRHRESIDGIDDLVPIERVDHGGGESTITFETAVGEIFRLRMRVERAGKRRLTCEATNPGRPRSFVELS